MQGLGFSWICWPCLQCFQCLADTPAGYAGHVYNSSNVCQAHLLDMLAMPTIPLMSGTHLGCKCSNCLGKTSTCVTETYENTSFLHCSNCRKHGFPRPLWPALYAGRAPGPEEPKKAKTLKYIVFFMTFCYIWAPSKTSKMHQKNLPILGLRPKIWQVFLVHF